MNPDEMGAEDPLVALKRLKAPTAPDPLEQLKALRPAPKHDYHAEYQSGALAKRMQGANDRDVANAAENTEAVNPLVAAGHALAATGANIAQGIPGMEAAQAGTRAVVRGQPYREALSDIRGQTDKIPAVLRTGERIAGALPLAATPVGPVAGGALLGGAGGALDANPDLSVADRATNTVTGAAAGAALGKAGEFVTTGARALLTKNPAANLIAQNLARAKSAKQLYSTAIREGQGRTGTPAIQQFLAEPDIAEIANELKGTRPFQNVPHDGPEMLDAIYKTLSDRAATLKRGLESVTPNRPNIGRFRMADTRAAQSSLLDAVSGGTSAPGPMPTMRTAVKDFADRSARFDATKQGYDALRGGISKRLPAGRNLMTKTPEGLAEWGNGITPAESEGATEGILGGTKMAITQSPLSFLLGEGRRAIMKAPSLMRSVGSESQALTDRLLKLGLIAKKATDAP